MTSTDGLSASKDACRYSGKALSEQFNDTGKRCRIAPDTYESQHFQGLKGDFGCHREGKVRIGKER